MMELLFIDGKKEESFWLNFYTMPVYKLGRLGIQLTDTVTLKYKLSEILKINVRKSLSSNDHGVYLFIWVFIYSVYILLTAPNPVTASHSLFPHTPPSLNLFIPPTGHQVYVGLGTHSHTEFRQGSSCRTTSPMYRKQLLGCNPLQLFGIHLKTRLHICYICVRRPSYYSYIGVAKLHPLFGCKCLHTT